MGILSLFQKIDQPDIHCIRTYFLCFRLCLARSQSKVHNYGKQSMYCKSVHTGTLKKRCPLFYVDKFPNLCNLLGGRPFHTHLLFRLSRPCGHGESCSIPHPTNIISSDRRPCGHDQKKGGVKERVRWTSDQIAYRRAQRRKCGSLLTVAFAREDST